MLVFNSCTLRLDISHNRYRRYVVICTLEEHPSGEPVPATMAKHQASGVYPDAAQDRQSRGFSACSVSEDASLRPGGARRTAGPYQRMKDAAPLTSMHTIAEEVLSKDKDTTTIKVAQEPKYSYQTTTVVSPAYQVRNDLIPRGCMSPPSRPLFHTTTHWKSTAEKWIYMDQHASHEHGGVRLNNGSDICTNNT